MSQIVRYWAFPERPLRRPKAAGRLPLTVVAFEAAERRHLVESGPSALERSLQEADVIGKGRRYRNG